MNEIEIDVKAGKKYSICSCGLSKSLPYCDNAHREFNLENSTQYKSIKIFPKDDTKIIIKASNWKNPPK
tara:strand:- start:134 stop:340 length:207 start_codon:yes stop_codon:yes gene_type:complete